MPETIDVEDGGHVVTVTINRPHVLNALNEATLRELQEVLNDVRAHPDYRCLILTGAGRAFVAGADIDAMKEITPEDARAFSQLGHNTFAAVEALPIPVIAAVNGFALGGGCELALACDFIQASEAATFGQPEVKLGIIPGFGGAQRLPRRVGIAMARELIYTGRMVGAVEALRIGLVNAVCAPDELLAKAHETATVIAEMGPLAVAAAKQALRESEDLPLADALSDEVLAFSRMFATADQREGMNAFLGRRPAQFVGR